ncbi:RNA polymerase II subunit A C-terminal domain phosphatase [Fistulifera solaris]|uniref:protein-serine/threonine phosphatase n=1 Tax=Fistulifera solaris TaxID=1519565 RepID=A0A1Z5JP34_FISSO|nr:RNA polymerase II subunit A C-terminal domain phosphatase [Fistulifera solaris]|eukprot:GAX15777.1 RNA polymerase II subunit A C-terminal domain phosphatase [Fistulifera solaris]
MTTENIVGFVELPSATDKLHCWKVRNGSSVRVGETIGLISKNANESGAGANTSNLEVSVVKSHKRPKRRMRPGDTVVATFEVTTTADSITTNSAVESASASEPKQDLCPLICSTDGILRIGRPPSTTEGQNSATIIGYIVKCLHPTVIEGLCAVCGNSMELLTSNKQAYSPEKVDDSVNMSRVTVAGVTVTISESEGQRMAEEDAERLRSQRKLSLVLDLDHTLVHATNDVRAQQYLHREDVRNLVLPMITVSESGHEQAMLKNNFWMQQHFVKLRPHVKEFLEMALALYEVGVYTAGTREYAEQITIMLARHLVGATRDQPDLEHLRYQVQSAESEFARHEAKSGGNTDQAHDADHADEQGNQAAETTDGKSRKRKRVTFTASKMDEKTDGVTAGKMAEMKQELEGVERLEAEAQEMRQKLFGSRVVSRTDVGDLGRDVKSLKRVFPCGGTMAVVVDDREDVWANAGEVAASTRKGEPPENLLLVRPYHWHRFVGYADVNNAAGFDLTRSQNEGDDESDEQLLWTSDILKRLHTRFYAKNTEDKDKTVADVLRSMRQEVLLGGSLVLSGLIPLHKQKGESNGPRPAVIRYAESLGAKVLPNVTSHTTHVVAAKDGTDKILAARQIPGCFVVKASWLMECIWTLKRSDEGKHLLGPPPQKKLADLPANDSDDDDDDDLVAELENELLNED